MSLYVREFCPYTYDTHTYTFTSSYTSLRVSSLIIMMIIIIIIIIIIGKANPLQTWAVAEGSRRLRLPDFKTIGT